MITSVRDKEIDDWFPAAEQDGYELTSCDTDDYNCIAWAAGLTNINWWPGPPEPGWDWPLPTSVCTLAAFIEAYKELRYMTCGMDGRLQRGYEKIAIYVDRKGSPTHAARQLSDGIWTSKLGGYLDIHHTTPRAIEDVPGRLPRITDYGSVAIYMRRKRRLGDVCLRNPGVVDIAPPYEPLFFRLVRWVLRRK